jgi:hypothetical protein
VVRQRSAKPLFSGSNPLRASTWIPFARPTLNRAAPAGLVYAPGRVGFADRPRLHLGAAVERSHDLPGVRAAPDRGGVVAAPKNVFLESGHGVAITAVTDSLTAFGRLAPVDGRGAVAHPKRGKLDVLPPPQMRLGPATLASKAHLEAVMIEYLRALLYAQLETAALKTASIESGVVSEKRE